MKTLINSSEIGMLSHWTNLVQVEEGDGALRTTDGSVDRYRRFPVGTYLIETQVNQMHSPRCFFTISAKNAEKFLAMPIEQAVAAMEREVA